jgi:hypothetical protein
MKPFNGHPAILSGPFWWKSDDDTFSPSGSSDSDPAYESLPYLSPPRFSTMDFNLSINIPPLADLSWMNPLQIGCFHDGPHSLLLFLIRDEKLSPRQKRRTHAARDQEPATISAFFSCQGNIPSIDLNVTLLDRLGGARFHILHLSLS